MKAQIILPLGNKICDIRINEIPNLEMLQKTNVEKYDSFHTDSLYFPNTLGSLEDGTPIELVVQDIYDTIEFYEHGISLAHLQEIFEELDVNYHLEMLIQEELIQAIQMTQKCILYKVSP